MWLRHPSRSEPCPAAAAFAGARGFTLIEIVVVLFIMATMAGFAMLALGDGGRGDRVRAEASRLNDAMELASEEAVVRSTGIGATIDADGYRFSAWSGDRWRSLDTDPILRARALPPGMELALDQPARSMGRDPQQPDLIFYASGESTPFRIDLADGGGADRYRLSGSGYGVFSMQDAGRVP